MNRDTTPPVNPFPAWSRTPEGRAWLQAEQTAFKQLPLYDQAIKAMVADLHTVDDKDRLLERALAGCGLGLLLRWDNARAISRQVRAGDVKYANPRMFIIIDINHPNWLMPVLPDWATHTRDMLLANGSHPQPDGGTWTDGYEDSSGWKPTRTLASDPRRLPVSKSFNEGLRMHDLDWWLRRESEELKDMPLWDAFHDATLFDAWDRAIRLYGECPARDTAEYEEWLTGVDRIWDALLNMAEGSGLEHCRTAPDGIRDYIREWRQDEIGGDYLFDYDQSERDNINGIFAIYAHIDHMHPIFKHPMLPHWALHTRDMLRSFGSNPTPDGTWDDEIPVYEEPEF
ncbi:hypothetical protein [Bifidobacterium felsineum]|uniref:hypothetical protein n=1 Tax=Bifidobacterium felsineum TaxID=2045440 RepID=UPI001BDC4AC5|nr:hypothetical protein [Bifidobacterium felsineum]MBT1164608.1 hypothetical protein [Bifidobacterium felsineum]